MFALDEIETLDGKSRNVKMRNLNNNNCEGNFSVAANVIVEKEDEEDSEDVYSKVFEGPPDNAGFQPNVIPKPAVRRKKRKDRDEIHKSANCPPSTKTKHVKKLD